MSQISKRLNLAIGLTAVFGLVGCATSPAARSHSTAEAKIRHMEKVRTTAYTHTEAGGRRNALGKYLSGHQVMSAASDWSRFPLGTRFRIAGTRNEYIIDDYGTALIGTNTIDLYKTSRLEMKRWGVRHVDIDVLQWGSELESLKVLGPRAKHRSVRRMITSLEKKRGKTVAQVSNRTSL
jgi:3D (Asp-Asp-Asp) domain-containing protein